MLDRHASDRFVSLLSFYAIPQALSVFELYRLITYTHMGLQGYAIDTLSKDLNLGLGSTFPRHNRTL